MELLQRMPDQKVETIYTYIYFASSQMDTEETVPQKRSAKSISGIAHKYVNPDLIPLEDEVFANAMAEKHATDRR